MNNRQFTWRHLKALHQLYEQKRTEAKITDNVFIKNILMSQRKLIKYKSGNTKILEALSNYAVFYEQNFKNNYELYSKFLLDKGLEDDARRKYSEDDIKTLIFIAEYQSELSKNLSTIRTFSSEIFKGHGSKYLENKPGLKKAVCTLLGIDDFPDKDPKNLQWRLVVDCLNPVAIVLCENIAHLKNPWKAREYYIELWYVGGNNIGIIDYISSEKLAKSVYYSCDWDFHGLTIYSRIKEKLIKKSIGLKILKPYSTDLSISVNSEHHKSKWDFNKPLSGLKKEDFDALEMELIQGLIKENKWIEEESMDFVQLLDYNNL